MVSVIELFAGIGAFRKAFINLGIPHEVVGISEIDKFAVRSYEALYGKTYNFGDISKITELPYADLWTYGFPCQDISLVGQQAGIVKGQTRSGLLYEVERLLNRAKAQGTLPKYLIMENVKNLVGKKFKSDFLRWLDTLDELGYRSYWQILDAQNYGIPQHRERVFCISIRKDLNREFHFPSPESLELSMADVLDEVGDVDEKYYLSDAMIQYFTSTNDVRSKLGFKFEPVERERESSQDTGNQRRKSNRKQFHNRRVLNTEQNGTCRTLKAQYYKTGLVNIMRTKYPATGVIELYE